MALTDRLVKIRPVSVTKSKIGRLLETLPDDERLALDKALRDNTIQHSDIARALDEEHKDTGDNAFKVSVASVKRFRDDIGVIVVGSQREA